MNLAAFQALDPKQKLQLLAVLSPAERAELVTLTMRRPAWRPFPGPQTAAYASKANILLYGGAAGGGKTDLLLGLARGNHRRSVIFRRVFPSLRAIIDRSREIYNVTEVAPGAARPRDPYNESLFRWRFPDGRMIRFGSMQYEKDRLDWQGQAHDFFGFDEITEFSETQFRFVTGWNRSTHPGQVCRVVCAGNPPVDAAGDWVIKFWGPWLDDRHPHPAVPGELRWFTTIAGKDQEVPDSQPVRVGNEWVVPISRTFIPARVQDNPILMEAGYVSRLQALPEPLRSKMLYGDFTAGRDDPSNQVIPTSWVRDAQARWEKRVKADGKPKTQMSALGVDVARGGKDKTILAPRFDNFFDEVISFPGSSTPNGPVVAQLVLSHRGPRAIVNIDVIGVGGSPYDILLPVLKDNLKPINGAEGSELRDKSDLLGFANKRAEIYWKFREALDPASGMDIALPPDAELLADLTAATWKMCVRGIQIESKDEIVKRIGRSPDRGDAVIYAHAQPDTSNLDFLRTMSQR